MSSNNPFASALNEPDSYVHRREPPPVPRANGNGAAPPARPPKPDSLAPPAYEEVSGSDKAKGDYPREKLSSSSRSHSSGRPHRSHSDSSRPHRSHRSSSGTDKDRERDRHHKSSRNKSPKKKVEPIKAKNLDTIDKLDVTAFFGGGFHHDGPFDACTPHRNKNAKSAPVMAFPADGPNNSIKGLAGNVDKNEQMNLAFGHYDVDNRNGFSSGRRGSASPVKEEFVPVIKTSRASDDPQSLYTPKQNPSVVNFDANIKAEPIHGSTTAGLGSSTFIDGAPAPKVNDEFLNVSGSGLGRKKSLVQRLRKNSLSEASSRRNSNDNVVREGRSSFGEGDVSDSNGGGSSLLRRVKSLKVGRK